jgi:DeoR family transcriptional regulator of aga operon
MDKHAGEKRRIAIAAADLIQDGNTLSLTAGTTRAAVTRSVRHHSGITVVTNTTPRWIAPSFISRDPARVG